MPGPITRNRLLRDVAVGAPPDRGAPAAAGADNVYNLTVQVSDGTFADTQVLTVTVTNVAEAPVITSNGAGPTAAVNVPENTNAVTTVTVQIVQLLTGDQEFDSAKTLAAFALGLLLFIVTLILNLIALTVVRRYREAYE